MYDYIDPVTVADHRFRVCVPSIAIANWQIAPDSAHTEGVYVSICFYVVDHSLRVCVRSIAIASGK